MKHQIDFDRLSRGRQTGRLRIVEATCFRRIALLGACLSLLAGSFAQAQSVFVRTDGNDLTGRRNDPNYPFRTLQKADSVALPGDTIFIGSGDYTGPITMTKALSLRANGGVVRLGLPAPSPTLAVNAGQDFALASGIASLYATASVANTAPVSSWHWQKVSGPGRAFSRNWYSQGLDFYVSASGAYEMRVVAGNGSLTAADTVKVTFLNPVLRTDPGSDQVVPFPSTATLHGLVLVDDKPNPEAVFRWRNVTGPGTATIGSPHSLSTTVTVSEKGVYAFLLEAWYRGDYFSDRVYIGFGMQLPTGLAGVSSEAAPSARLSLKPCACGIQKETAFHLAFDGAPGAQYRIDASDDLVSWSPLTTSPGAKEPVLIHDPAATEKRARFYRAVEEKEPVTVK